MAELKLVITHFKILDTIYELNQHSLYPNAEGVFKIVTGVSDEEMRDYEHIKTYGTLISYGSKKVARYIMMLQRNGYVKKVFDAETNNLFLEIRERGISALKAYHKRHKNPYVRKTVNLNKTIVKIAK
jgi:hypothetical protein